jgi:hypothetical protein
MQGEPNLLYGSRVNINNNQLGRSQWRSRHPLVNASENKLSLFVPSPLRSERPAPLLARCRCVLTDLFPRIYMRSGRPLRAAPFRSAVCVIYPKARRICGQWLAGISGANAAWVMDVCLL